MSSAFQSLTPNIIGNSSLREPQICSYEALQKFHNEQFDPDTFKEAGIVLPVGCGKSGCITLTPFAFKSKRALVIAPGVAIAQQLQKDFEPYTSFYKRCSVLTKEFPEAVEIRGTDTNLDDLKESDVVITNIQQLQGVDNKWLDKLEDDFFDLIVFDEGHHSVAQTWNSLKEKFPKAAVVNYSATPERSDGQIMSGEVVYSFPIAQAIKSGYVKELKGVVLNPQTLRYVRNEGGNEVEVSLEEVIKLGEEDAGFRRSIVTSKESLNTIVDASIHQLMNKRQETGNNKLKIIASALNYQHCIQIVEAYRARGLTTDYVHSKNDSRLNDRVLSQLNAHELDVIVQVRKLNEGFDHPYLSVAAVFSVFSNLSPFVQFVGRIMRVITQNDPDNPLNKGVVVFHAGSNIANRWTDFKKFSKADQEYYNQLLPLEAFPVTAGPKTSDYEIFPKLVDDNEISVRSQADISISELNLIDDPKALEALEYLMSIGATGKIEDLLESIPTSKVQVRKAKRKALPERVKTSAMLIVKRLKLNPNGKNLDKSFRLPNLAYVISQINSDINKVVGKKSGCRSELNIKELELIDSNYGSILIALEDRLK
ncbi:DEAD/DEAH box helicase [Vibrio splendidus]|uniref:DEAD/DEAH box helicase n=1 Tax=Vibrio splendidus TaxID=29497 RepID=UPI000D3ADC91|nr:DEAD/DEAH box helicase family protein [Vibrio splendidus]PTO90158.1 DEAD/DEAH box helicase [Vibrio splendidus]PTP50449.1 DEAD/DEAH box helicase [Vibrio splendidus]